MLNISDRKNLKGFIKAAGGIRLVAEQCGVSYEAVRKWTASGRLPRSEWTGETTYAKTICAMAKQRHPFSEFDPLTLLHLIQSSAA